MSGLRPQNTFTNISGRAKFERFVTSQVWREEVLPVIQQILPSLKFKAKAKIARWTVESVGDDQHIHDFFVRNWHAAENQDETHIHSWHIAHCKNSELLRKILGLKSDLDVASRRDQFLKFLEDPLFRVCLKDSDYLNFAMQSDERQRELAVFAPAFIYCPEERSSVSLNTTYYGQFKSKSVLGILEEYLIQQMAYVRGDLKNAASVWLSMHAGGAEYFTQKREKRGIIIVGPTGTAKSTHAYGLSEAKNENRIHSDDWLFVNIGTGEVLGAERSFYMRTPMARFYTDCTEKFLSAPLENVPFTEAVLQILKNNGERDLTSNENKSILRDLCATLAARALVLAEDFLPEHKRCSEMKVTDIFIVKRDEGSASVIRKIKGEEMIRFLVSQDNVFQYRRDPDRLGEEVFDKKTTEYYLNPYLCRTDFYKGNPGDLDRRRIDAWTHLASMPRISIFELNAFLPVPVTQFCLRRFLEGDLDEISFKGGMVEFKLIDKVLENIVFTKAGDFSSADQAVLNSWSLGDAKAFFKHYEYLNAAALFSI